MWCLSGERKGCEADWKAWTKLNSAVLTTRFVQDIRVSINIFIRTLVAPPREFALGAGASCVPATILGVHVVPELTLEARVLPSEHELILWFGAPDPRGGPNLFNAETSAWPTAGTTRPRAKATGQGQAVRG